MNSSKNQPVRPLNAGKPAGSADSAKSGRRNPAVAVGLCFVLPGAGQIYNGEKAKGCILISLTVVIIVAAVACGVMAVLDPSPTMIAVSSGLAVFVFPAIALYASVDAFVGANRANERLGI